MLASSKKHLTENTTVFVINDINYYRNMAISFMLKTVSAV